MLITSIEAISEEVESDSDTVMAGGGTATTSTPITGTSQAEDTVPVSASRTKLEKTLQLGDLEENTNIQQWRISQKSN